LNPQTQSLIDQLFRPSDADLFGAADIFLAMFVSTLLAFALTQVYRHTHRGTSYSQSFLVTLFIMAIATSVVMMIIGSNIARAFSLVGALSIIRFRTAVKDARDTGYLFAAMIAGMGCGTQFYLAAVSMTAFISVLLLILHHVDYGLKQTLESVLRVTYRVEGDTLGRIERELEGSFGSFRLINRILDFGPDEETNVYVVGAGDDSDPRRIEERLRSIDGVVNLAIYQSDQHTPF